MFELLINILLVVFFGYSYFFHVTEAPIPKKVAMNPYVFQPSAWPKAIIILLELCLILNIISIIRKNKGNENFTLSAFFKSIPVFLKSKVFLGIVILVVASFILEPLGFMVTCLFVLIGYGLLLGQKNYVQQVVVAVVITLILYIIFSGLLSVNLPRGTVGFLRNFALAMESVVASVKGIFGF